MVVFYTHQDREDDFKKSGQKDTSNRTSRPESTLTARDDDIEALERVATQEDHESYEEKTKKHPMPLAKSEEEEPLSNSAKQQATSSPASSPPAPFVTHHLPPMEASKPGSKSQWAGS